MANIKCIREFPEIFDHKLQLRGLEAKSKEILDIDEELIANKHLLQELQTQRNEIARQIGALKSQGQDTQHLMSESEEIKQRLPDLAQKDHSLSQKLQQILDIMPNMILDDVPEGKDEQDNLEIKKHGIIPIFSFKPKNHWDLGENLEQMDFKNAVKISGSRFVLLRNDLAKLERALQNFMLDIHTQEHGYEETFPPSLVTEKSMYNVGQLPKFAEESFVTTDGMRLIPTAEVPLTNIVADTIISELELPYRFTSYTQCYRRESGSAGRDTRGMIRNHQFSKVELVSIVRPQESKQEHERMLNCAEEILKRLDLPYRVMILCSGDTGFAAAKTYDIEVWLPGQNCYREISSCSYFGDFQARRMNARYKNHLTQKNEFVHTLNGSALAIGRTIVAILENYQQENGAIAIPKNLVHYMNMKTKIEIPHESE